MCAIVGILTEPQPEERGAAWQELLGRMMRALSHRGPDGEGRFVDRGGAQQLYLGHRRLDVFAPGPLGAQPMTGPGLGPGADRRYALSFNGAIYNYVELGDSLGLSGEARRSDSAVLLAAWATWGPACLTRLNGMFAFALWDSLERTLYLCRDRFGEKPLLYTTAAGGARLIFASEAKGIFATGLLQPRLHADQLAEFLATHDIDHRGNVDGTTVFDAVRQVPAGCYLRIGPRDGSDKSGPPPIRYYTVTPPRARRALDAELVEEARELLTSAVRLRLRSDVPLGGSLSGGLDSSLLSALVTRNRSGWLDGGRPYPIFTCQFPEARDPADESTWAEQVLTGLSRDGATGEVVRVRPGAREFLDDLEHVLFHQEAPFADASICSHHALMKAVRGHGVTVLLSGQGGDEVFAGYPSYYHALLGWLLSARRFSSLWRHAWARAGRLSQLRAPVRSQLLARQLAGAVYHALPGRLRHHLYKQRRHGLYPLSATGQALLESAPVRFGGPLPGLCGEPQAEWSPFDVYLVDCMERWALPHILRHDDRNSMAFGVESRAPYLDHRLLELLLSVEPEGRIGDGYTKRLLREVATGILPEPVRLRVDKMGFFSPQCDWLWRSEDAVRAACAELPAELRALTDAAVLSRQIDAFYRERRRELAAVVWTAFSCSLYFSRVLPRLAHAGI